jgi:hypothetical protein
MQTKPGWKMGSMFVVDIQSLALATGVFMKVSLLQRLVLILLNPALKGLNDGC